MFTNLELIDIQYAINVTIDNNERLAKTPDEKMSKIFLEPNAHLQEIHDKIQEHLNNKVIVAP